jgi:Methylamine utilisation protein MauE
VHLQASPQPTNLLSLMTEWTMLARFTTGFILAFASVGKLSDLTQFAVALREYEILPQRLIALGAKVVVVFEAILAAALFSGTWMRLSLGIASILFVGFAAAVAWALARGRNIDCGCFGGILRTKVSRSSVVANSAVAGLAVVAIPLSEPIHAKGSVLSYLVVGTCSLLLAGVYVLAAYAASVRLRLREIGEGSTA